MPVVLMIVFRSRLTRATAPPAVGPTMHRGVSAVPVVLARATAHTPILQRAFCSPACLPAWAPPHANTHHSGRRFTTPSDGGSRLYGAALLGIVASASAASSAVGAGDDQEDHPADNEQQEEHTDKEHAGDVAGSDDSSLTTAASSSSSSPPKRSGKTSRKEKLRRLYAMYGKRMPECPLCFVFR